MLAYYSLLFYLSLTTSPAAAAASSDKSKADHLEPCTIRSPTSHAFYDLNPLHISPPDPEHPKRKLPARSGLLRSHSWNATGHDIGYNFTMNFCGGVVEDLHDVQGVERDLWRNVSAYYQLGGKTYSIGQQNSVPVFRGRKLVLNYTGGSPCEDFEEDKDSQRAVSFGGGKKAVLGKRQFYDDQDAEEGFKFTEIIEPGEGEDDGEKERKKNKGDKGGKAVKRRKNTIISVLCDKDTMAPHLTLSFVGASPDQCTYMFEARSASGCPAVETAQQSLSPSGVFGIIALVAIAVYLVGGCVYSRVVLNQRGWRQVPNYSLWAGILSFISDIFVILTSSCARFLPSRRGYSRVQSNGAPYSARGRDSEANRLIDELNEEWED